MHSSVFSIVTWVHILYGVLIAKQQLRACARASVCTHTRALTWARTVHIHALACVVQLITFDPCRAPALALALALGGQTRRTGSDVLLLLLLIPRGSIHHSAPLVTVKWSGIPSVLGRGCASGPESVPGTITRRGAPLYLSQSLYPHRGNIYTSRGQFGYFWQNGRSKVPSEDAEVRDCFLSRDKEKLSMSTGAYSFTK